MKGKRRDKIQTQSSNYKKGVGSITYRGEVQVALKSRTKAKRAARNPGKKAEQKVRVETRGGIFNRANGMARTDQPVKFIFPNGEGEAVGVEYHSEEGTVRLLRNVRFSLMAPQKTTAGKKTANEGAN